MAERVGTSPSELGPRWQRSEPIQLLDFGCAFHSDDPILIDLVHDLYAPIVGRGGARHRLVLGHAVVRGLPGYFVAIDGAIVVRTPAPTIAFAHLMFEANQQAIERSTRLVRVHAAAVSIGGCAAVIAGPMGAGKSTLAAALVQRGAGYVTDEVAAFDPATALIVPYPKPISLGNPPPALGGIEWVAPPGASAFLGDSGLVPASVVGPAVVVEPVPIGPIVLTRYVPGAPTQVRRLHGADALAAVAAQTFQLGREGSLPALARVLEPLPCHELVSGDLIDAARTVEELTLELAGAQ